MEFFSVHLLRAAGTVCGCEPVGNGGNPSDLRYCFVLMQPARSTTWKRYSNESVSTGLLTQLISRFVLFFARRHNMESGSESGKYVSGPEHTRTVSRWWSARYSNESLNSTTPGPPFHAGPPTACSLHLLRIFSLVSALFSAKQLGEIFFLKKDKKNPL